MDAFLASLTPQAYEELAFSFQLDPPAEDRLRTTNNLLADLLAVYYSVHRDAEQRPDPFTRADFLPDPEQDDGEDEDADVDVDAPLHPMFAGGVTAGLPPMRGHGGTVSPGILSLFAQANAGEE